MFRFGPTEFSNKELHFELKNFSCVKSETFILGRRIPANSKEECIKFPSRWSEILWLLNEDGEELFELLNENGEECSII